MTLDAQRESRQALQETFRHRPAGMFARLGRVIRTAITRIFGAAPAQPPGGSSTARRGGRRLSYHPDRPATAAERGKQFRERETREREAKKANVSANVCANVCPSHSLLKKENKKKGAHPIPEDWHPNEEGLRLGIEAFGADGVERAIRKHRNLWLGRPEEKTDAQWQATWCAWSETNLEPSFALGPQKIATLEKRKRHGRRRGSISATCDELIARAQAHESAQAAGGAPQTIDLMATDAAIEKPKSSQPHENVAAPASTEDKAKVQSKLDWFRGRGNKEASG